MSSLTSQLIVKLLDRVTEPARRVTNAMRGITTLSEDASGAQVGFLDRVDGAIARNEQALASARTGLMEASVAFYALQRALRRPLTVAADFEMSMNNVAAISGATASELERFNEQARELGRTTPFTAQEAADAMGFLAMAGFEAEQIMGAMPRTLDLATAAQMGLADTADLVSNVLQAYRMEVSDLDRASDVLVRTFTSSNTSLAQLGDAFRYAAPMAAAAGLEFEEVLAVLGTMGNAGIQASMAGTAVRGAMMRMLNPTKSVEDALADLGVEGAEASDILHEMEGASDDISGELERIGVSFTDAAGKLRPFEDIVRQLEPYADDAGLMGRLFGARAGPAMTALIAEGADALSDFTEDLRKVDGDTLRVAAVQMEGLKGATRRLQSAVDGLNLALGTALTGNAERVVEVLTSMAGVVTELVERYPGLTSGVISAVAALVGLRLAIATLKWSGLFMVGSGLRAISVAGHGVVMAAAAVKSLAAGAAFAKMAPGLAAAGAAAKGLGAALAVLKWPITALVVGGLLVRRYWDRIKAVLQGVGDAVAEFLRPELQWLGEKLGFLEPVLDGFSEAWQRVRDGMSAVADFASNVLSGVFDRELLTDGEAGAITDRAYQVTNRVIGAFRTIPIRLGSLRDDLIQAGRDLIQGLWDGAVEQFNRFLDWVRTIPQRIREAIGNIDLSNIISWPSRPSWLGGGGESAPAPGARARGGPISAGRSYWTGEDGPELITPTRRGYVHSADTDHGGAPISVSPVFNFASGIGAGDAAEIERRVRAALTDEIGAMFRGALSDTGVKVY